MYASRPYGYGSRVQQEDTAYNQSHRSHPHRQPAWFLGTTLWAGASQTTTRERDDILAGLDIGVVLEVDETLRSRHTGRGTELSVERASSIDEDARGALGIAVAGALAGNDLSVLDGLEGRGRRRGVVVAVVDAVAVDAVAACTSAAGDGKRGVEVDGGGGLSGSQGCRGIKTRVGVSKSQRDATEIKVSKKVRWQSTASDNQGSACACAPAYRGDACRRRGFWA